MPKHFVNIARIAGSVQTPGAIISLFESRTKLVSLRPIYQRSKSVGTLRLTHCHSIRDNSIITNFRSARIIVAANRVGESWAKVCRIFVAKFLLARVAQRRSWGRYFGSEFAAVARIFLPQLWHSLNSRRGLLQIFGRGKRAPEWVQLSGY